jgi:hypothetical protein
MIEHIIKEARTNETMPLPFQQNIRLKLINEKGSRYFGR